MNSAASCHLPSDERIESFIECRECSKRVSRDWIHMCFFRLASLNITFSKADLESQGDTMTIQLH
jgi:hypothetical protein